MVTAIYILDFLLMALTMLNSPAEPTYRTFSRRSQLPLAPQYLWQIDSGLVRTLTWLEDGSMMTLGLWGPGDVLGKVLSSANPLQAECLTEVKVVPLPQDQWHQATPALIQHIRQLGELIEILHCPQIDIALMRTLNWLAQRFGSDSQQGRQIDVRLTHQEIAELIGSTRVTVTRMLSNFERQGLIRRQQRSIILPSEAQPFWHYEI